MSAQPDPNRFYRPIHPIFIQRTNASKPPKTYQTFICAYNSKNADDDGKIHQGWKLIKTR